MLNTLAINSLNCLQEGNKSFLVLEGSGITTTIFDQVKVDNWPDRNELLARHATPDTAIF